MTFSLWTDKGLEGWSKRDFATIDELADFVLTDLLAFPNASTVKNMLYRITKTNGKGANITSLGDDGKLILNILKGQMGFTLAEAREATEHVIKSIPNGTLPNKVKEALKYFGKEQLTIGEDKLW